MQVVYKNENEKGSSRETDLVGTIIYVGRISKYMKWEHTRRFRGRNIRIYDNRRIFDRFEERTW